MIAFLPVLHPYHKLDYFKSAGWEDMWIATARDMVRDVYERSYASRRSHGHPGLQEEKRDVDRLINQVRPTVFFSWSRLIYLHE
jgi:hypothetical protein